MKVFGDRAEVRSENQELSRDLNLMLKQKDFQTRQEARIFLNQTLRERSYLFAQIKDVNSNRFFIFNVENPVQIILLYESSHKLSPLYLQAVLDKNQLDSSIQDVDLYFKDKLIKFLNAKGYLSAQVKTQVEVSPDTYFRKYIFSVNEGVRSNIRYLNVVGCESEPDCQEYGAYLKNRSSELIQRNIWVPEDLDQGLKNLKIRLHNEAYFQSKILRVETKKVKHSLSNELDVIVSVALGEQARIRKLEFIAEDPEEEIDTEWLTILAGINEGDRIKLNRLEQAIDQIYKFYLDLGHLQISINTEEEEILTYDEESNQVDIRVPIRLGPLIQVEKIIIEGLEKTKKSVVLNQIDFKIGDVLTQERLTSSEDRLKRSGLYTEIAIRLGNKLTKAHEIIIKLKDKLPGNFQFGFGMNNERGYTLRAFMGVGYRNLYGTARALVGRVELSSNISQINFLEDQLNISYLEPFFLGKKNNLRLSYGRYSNIWEIDDSAGTITAIESNNFDILFEKEYSAHLKATLKILSLDFRREFELDQQFAEITEVVSSIGLILDWDYRNNPFLPDRGSYSRFELDYAPSLLGTRLLSGSLEEDIDFLRFQGNYTRYDRLASSELVIASVVRAGYLYNLSSGTDFFPKSRAFFLGGTSTLRGYDPSNPIERVPAEEELNIFGGGSTGGSLLFLPRGSYYYLLKLELRHPLYFMDNVWGGLFYDAGGVGIGGVNITDTYRHSAGFGLRYHTPVGAINAEMGFKLDRKRMRGESPFEFHLSIGTF